MDLDGHTYMHAYHGHSIFTSFHAKRIVPGSHEMGTVQVGTDFRSLHFGTDSIAQTAYLRNINEIACWDLAYLHTILSNPLLVYYSESDLGIYPVLNNFVVLDHGLHVLYIHRFNVFDGLGGFIHDLLYRILPAYC